MTTSDLASSGFGIAWGHTRSYSNQLTDQEGGVNGNSWFIKEVPQLVKVSSTEICLISDIQEALWFDLISGSWVPRFFVLDTLVFVPDTEDPTNGKYVYTHTSGHIFKFFDFDASLPAVKRGQFKSFTDNYGNVTVADYGSDDKIASFVFSSGGSSTGYHYDYLSTTANAGKIQYVTLKVDSSNVRRCKYDYYVASDTYGSLGDLKRVTTQEYIGGSWVDVQSMLYRYYKDGDTNGFAHALKFVLGSQGYDLMVGAGITPETASTSEMRIYADNYFEYDSTSKAAVLEKVGGGMQSFSFARSSSGFSDGFNNWKTKATETLTDGNENIVYTNYVGQPMLKIFKAGSDKWYQYYKYDSQGRVILTASSAAVHIVNEAVSYLVDLYDEAGLVRFYSFYTSTNLEDGAVKGYLQSESVAQGYSGDPVKVREWKYASRTVGDSTIYPVWKEIVYQNEAGGGSDDVATTYDYTWFTGTLRFLQRTTTKPSVPGSQNGTGVAGVEVEVYDEYGRVTWRKDERGFLTRMKYNLSTGGLVQLIQDVKVASISISDTPAVPSGWVTPAGGGLHLITDYTIDNQGRVTQELGPVHSVDLSGTSTAIRRARWTVYKDQEHEMWAGQGYTNSSGSSPYLFNPVNITKFDGAARETDRIQATRGSDVKSSGALVPTDSFPQSTWIRWTSMAYDNRTQLSWQRVYSVIPSSGEGSPGTNYDETTYGYDSMQRQNRVRTPGGTITRTVYSPHGWVAETWMGTNDTGATESNPSNSGTAPNNLVKVSELEYDDGAAGGDGNLTLQTLSANGSTTRATAFTYDWRNRRLSTDGEIDFYESYTYDNLDRLLVTERRDTNSSGALGSKSISAYDNLGRIFRTVKQGTNGSIGHSLEDNSWYDLAGNLVRQLPSGSAAFQMMEYDSLNRVSKRYTAFGPGNVTGDTILQQDEMTYDDASSVIFQVSRERFHDATGTGPLTTPTDSQPKARVSYVANYPDPLGRVVNVANYGTNAGSVLSRPSTCAARSDVVLVTTTDYNNRGEAWQVTDPNWQETDTKAGVRRSAFDAAGRVTQTIENYVSSETEVDQNKTTNFTYNADGNLATLTAVNATTGNQVTTYVYGTTLTDSDVASSRLLRAVVYPDSTSGSDRVEYKYNRLGERTEMKDQRGTVHSYDFDLLGRLVQDRIPTLPDSSAVDGAVRRVSRTYEFRGMLAKITCYSNATVGSGSIVNESAFTYNEFGQLTKEEQAHGGAVGSGTPAVQYTYANGSDNHIRPISVIYPDARVLTFNYND